MFKKLRKKIESKRNSKSLFWGVMVSAKDGLWRVMWIFKKGYTFLRPLFPIYFWDPFLGKMVDLRKKLEPKNRKWGVSGYMRLRNEAEFIGRVIESVIKPLDELVIVYNRCTDRTPEIVEKYRKKHPSKIKVYPYKPWVYPQGSKEYAVLSPNSPHSLINYYNFALAQTTRKVVVKIDGDDLFIPELFKAVVDNIKKNGLNKYLDFLGINLWDENGKIYVNGNRPTMGGRAFFPVNKRIYHIKVPIFEYLVHNLNNRGLGILFFHMKGVKKNRGIGVFDLEDSPNSIYHEWIKKWYTNPKLIPWEKFKRENSVARNIPNPNSLGFRILKRRKIKNG